MNLLSIKNQNETTLEQVISNNDLIANIVDRLNSTLDPRSVLISASGSVGVKEEPTGIVRDLAFQADRFGSAAQRQYSFLKTLEEALFESGSENASPRKG